MSHPAPARDIVYDRANRRLLDAEGKPTSYIREDEFASLLVKPSDELQKWRISGRFDDLDFTKVGKLIRYHADTVIAFLEKHSFKTTEDAGSKMSAKSNRLRSQKMKVKWAEKKKAKAEAAHEPR